MPIVFGQGMRRSGTTILFDLFWGDGRMRCWYEPLNRARAKPGGGSRAREVDYSAPVRELRRELVERRADGTSEQDYNWGAPTRPELEFESEFPEHVREYVREMVARSPDTLIKFTRASHKVGELHAIRPDAHFLHLVRDPRAVATSHLFRTDPAVRDRMLAEGSFFTGASGFDQWRSETMANWLVGRRPEYARFAGEPAFLRTMMLWKELYTRTRDDARRLFGERYRVVWHDALCADPAGVLRDLHRAWGWKPRLRTLWWARRNVRPARPWHAPEHPEWRRAMDALELDPLVEECRSGAAGARAR